MIGKTFLRLERDFDKHVNYCRDESNAQEFLFNNEEVREFFEVSGKLRKTFIKLSSLESLSWKSHFIKFSKTFPRFSRHLLIFSRNENSKRSSTIRRKNLCLKAFRLADACFTKNINWDFFICLPQFWKQTTRKLNRAEKINKRVSQYFFKFVSTPKRSSGDRLQPTKVIAFPHSFCLSNISIGIIFINVKTTPRARGKLMFTQTYFSTWPCVALQIFSTCEWRRKIFISLQLSLKTLVENVK